MSDDVSTPGRRRVNADPFLLVLLALSLAANVWLGLQVRQNRAAGAPPAKLRVGDVLPPLQARDASGQPVALRADDDARPTVFYLYSHTCGWCRRNEPAVAALAQQVGERYRFVGLCIGTEASCARREGDPPFSVYAGLMREQIADFGLGAVPQTIVVARDSRVARIFRGAWVQDQHDDVQAYFGASLPALDPRPAAVSDALGH